MVLTTVTETKTTTVIETTTTTVTTVIDTDNVGKPAWNNNTSMQAVLVEGTKLWPSLSRSTNKSFAKLSSPNSNTDSNNIDSTEANSTEEVDKVPEIDISPMSSPTSVSNNPAPNNLDLHSTTNDEKSTKQDAGDDTLADKESNGNDDNGSSEPNSSHSLQKHDSSALASQRENVAQVHPHQNSLGKPHFRGEASHQNNWGRRNGPGRGYSDWNHQMNFVRPPHFYPPFVPFYPVMQPFIPPMMHPVYHAPGVQFAQPPVPFYPSVDHQLYFKIMKQIDFYFSTENLVKDTFLRKQMDRNGWVSVDLISEFNKVKQLCKYLTNRKRIVLEALKPSTVVQVHTQGRKIRRRGDWSRWVLPPSFQDPRPFDPQIPQIMNQ